MKLRLLSLLYALCVTLTSMGQDSVRISFLTCGPGTESYSLYGHTALRVQNLESGEDLVYNYGMFDFNAPNFAWRFTLGQTDYFLGVQPFSSFIANYAYHNRWVDEQELLLRPEEKQKVVNQLQHLAWQEDWTYRYNFLRDNCTTRALQSVEEAINGELQFALIKQENAHTYRNILHQFAEAAPWDYVGNDLLLGAEVDKPLSVRQQCFSPIYAEHFLTELQVKRADGSLSPLATKPVRILSATPAPQPNKHLPLFCLLTVCILLAGVSVWEVKRRRWWRGIDFGLCLLQGLAGCIVAFLFFFSEHPAVDSNWNLLWCNPLPLLLLPSLATKRGLVLVRICFLLYTLIFFALCAISLAEVQRIIIEIILLASLLLIRVSAYLYANPKTRHL